MEATPAIKLAKEMGLFVLVSDGSKTAPGVEIADDAIISSTYDIHATVRLALDFHKSIRPIGGVICVASDVPKTVAAVAEALNLPGISRRSAELVSDKILMKQSFAETGVPIPEFMQVYSGQEVLQFWEEKCSPIVIKPADSRGSRGVYLIDDPSTFDLLFQ